MNLAGTKNTVCATGPVPRRPGASLTAPEPDPDHDEHGTEDHTEMEVDPMMEELLFSLVDAPIAAGNKDATPEERAVALLRKIQLQALCEEHCT